MAFSPEARSSEPQDLVDAHLQSGEFAAARQIASGLPSVQRDAALAQITQFQMLGGGPAATTLEVAIYQVLTFDFDISRAVVLTLLQFALQGSAMHAQTARGSRNVAVIFVHYTLNMLPLHSWY